VRSGGGSTTGADERPRGEGRCSRGVFIDEKRKKWGGGVWHGGRPF
jgi:hypothetical protein